MLARLPESFPIHRIPVAQPDATITRLDEQIDWYDRKSRASQRRFKGLKTLQMMLAAAIPVLAATHVPVYPPRSSAAQSSCWKGSSS